MPSPSWLWKCAIARSFSSGEATGVHSFATGALSGRGVAFAESVIGVSVRVLPSSLIVRSKGNCRSPRLYARGRETRSAPLLSCKTTDLPSLDTLNNPASMVVTIDLSTTFAS